MSDFKNAEYRLESGEKSKGFVDAPTDLQSQLDEAIELLVRANAMSVAVSCPECDGGGAIPHGNPYADNSGDVIVEWQQCQWCDEQKQISDFLSKQPKQDIK